jgi:hypothetical protein
MTQWIGRCVLSVALLPALYFSGDMFLERALFSAPPLWGNAIGYLHEYGWSKAAYPGHRTGIECLLVSLVQVASLYFVWPSKNRLILILIGIVMTALSYVIYLQFLTTYEPVIFKGPYLDIDDTALRQVTEQWERWDQRRWLLSSLGAAITLLCLIWPAQGNGKSITNRTT